jgi:Uma2 family endonuclease
MVTFIHEDEKVSVPGWVVDLDSFRRWTDDDDFPQTGRIWWLRGEVWVDMSKEQIFSHILVKTKMTTVLGALAETEQLGLFLADGLLLSNYEADISGNPDATFISTAGMEAGAVRLIEGKKGGYVELQGSPDMVLEVVSDSSKHKDQVVLRQAYWEAGVREYWLVNALTDPLRFDILRHTPRGDVAARKQDGWVRSAVFGKSFRLVQRASAFKHPDYLLEVR